MSRVFRSINEPLRKRDLTWEERWAGPDAGLITCWEVGRRLRDSDPTLVDRVMRGELPSLGWKGGVEKPTKKMWIYGTLYYLAQLQGLRGEDLNIDTSTEPELVCSKTMVRVIYTRDLAKYGRL